MPELPAEAVTVVPVAALERLVKVAEYVSRGRGFVGVGPYPDATARFALGALADAGGGSPTTCPSVTSESTESAQNPSAAPVYRPGVEKPAESLTALRALARVRALHNPVEYGGMTICAACSPFHEGGIRRYVLTPYPCSTVLVLDGAGAVPGEHTGSGNE